MIVYKNYSQQELNDQYNNRLHVPDYANYFERWEKLSRQTENEYTLVKDIAYGEHARERLDIFPAKVSNTKTLVFIHGGYWHLFDKSLFHFLAATFLQENVTTVLINYPLAPAANMNDIVSSCGAAMQWLYKNIMNYNGDPEAMYVMGHSAGAHLAAMLLCDDNTNFLKGGTFLSGLYELEPVILSYVNDILGLDKATALENSPVFFTPVNQCPLLFVAGSSETDEFKDQTTEIYEHWKSKHSAISLLQIAGKNHYSILDAVTEKSSVLQSAIFRMMDINSCYGSERSSESTISSGSK